MQLSSKSGLSTQPFVSLRHRSGRRVGPEVAAVINNEKEPLKAMQDAAARMQPILDRCCKK
jgi:hypothetical protein